MTEINIKDIKKIEICWDWEYALIPKEYIKRLIYNKIKSSKYGNGIFCNYVSLEIDLEYIKTHKLCKIVSNDLNFKESIFDVLQEKNIWSLTISYNNEENIEINLPSYRKEAYCSEKKYLNVWDAKNSCENHKIQDNNYIIEWKELEEKDTYMNSKEMSTFFKKGNLSKISNNTNSLGIEIVDRILKSNMKENTITDKIEQLSKKDGGKVIVFDKYKENVIKIIQRLHNVEHRRNVILGIKKGYKCTEEYYPIHGTDIVLLYAQNHAHHWNFNFILVEKMDNQKDEENLYKVICDGEPNDDTKNCFCMRVFIFNDNVNIEEAMLDFYRRVYKNSSKRIIYNEKLLFTTYSEINKIWYDIHKEWDLL